MSVGMKANELIRNSAVVGIYAQMGFREYAKKLLGVFEKCSSSRRVTAMARILEHLARVDEDQALYWLEIVVAFKGS
jgi:hypothetical protein